MTFTWWGQERFVNGKKVSIKEFDRLLNKWAHKKSKRKACRKNKKGDQ